MIASALPATAPVPLQCFAACCVPIMASPAPRMPPNPNAAASCLRRCNNAQADPVLIAHMLRHKLRDAATLKNLPKHADDARLKKHFSSLGTVTDAKVMRTKDGKSRLFGFVGYATEKEAAKALKHFDNTFLDTSRLAVQLAKPRGDGEIARPWSKYSAGSNKAAKAAAAAAGGGEFEVEHVSRGYGGGSDSGSESEEQGRKSKGQVKELEKQEFMEAMQRRSNAKFWANDDASAAARATVLSSSAQADTKQKRIKRSAVSAAQADDSSSGSSSDSASDAGGSAAQSDEGSDDGYGDAGASKSVSDMDWLRTKQKNVPEDSSAAKKKRQRSGSVTSSTTGSDDSDAAAGVADAESGASPQADSGDHTSGRGAKAGGMGAAAAAEGGGGGASIRGSSRGGGDGGEGAERTGRLFVRNLAYACTEEDLSELFGGYGALEGVHVTVDDMNRCKGFAFVQFVDAEHAGRALEALDGRSFQGRLLHVIPARKAPGENGAGTAAGGGGTFKAQREKERRARAQDGVGWNASFVRGDTVVDALADRLGVGKGEVCMHF
ncbi:hypothetical protein JKP88DRAFT_261997 [Tribonema minus]|uniref:RRM domain-containing protein n=1 Tax=Tribonema minus TaxID=303371 RepID=A0A835ZDM8_9STRA|nr:hypothetical protein JKP88DRAFT_261997 [Tribonema minus]